MLSAWAFAGCLEVDKFVQEVFVYEPSGHYSTIADLKMMEADALIDENIYVQGVVTSSDAEGNWSRRIVFQDESGAVSVMADLGSSNELFPIGQKISVQCRNMTLADVGGVRILCAGVQGEGLRKSASAIDNRTARSTIFAVEGGKAVTPRALTLSELNADTRAYEDCLVTLQGVFFQTHLLPYANEGGSSEQYRTLYDSEGGTALLCTSDGSTMAGEPLPEGKGTITGILTYPNGSASIMIRSLDDVAFSPSSDTEVNDPNDRISDIIISEYYENEGAVYIEIFNTGEETVDLGGYALACDTSSDGNFTQSVALDSQKLGPFGMAVYCNSKAAQSVIAGGAAEWDPLRTNYSQIRIDNLAIDGNSQVALMKSGEVADLLSTTNKYGWAQSKTFIRRPNIKGHSRPSDYTRADAGWILKIAGYTYNMGNHRYFDYDPDFDSPQTVQPCTILDVRGMAAGRVSQALSVTGRVTSDSEGGNVAADRLFMQDGSNRGLCVAFRKGQNHAYKPGDEITVELLGANLVDEQGLWVADECVVSRSLLTDAPNEMPEPIEASVSQIPNLQSMYIYIKDVEAADDGLGKTYGSADIRSYDLFANEFYISTLAGAVFAQQSVTDKSGSIKGIAAVQNGALIVMPRNSGDLEAMTEARFMPITAEPVPVSRVKQMAAGKINEDVRVTVTVTTDNTGGNMPGGKIFVQDDNDGFMLQLPADNEYAFGQTLIVVMNGATISNDGEFVVTPESAQRVVATGAPDPSLQPVSITPSQLKSNLHKLVTVANVQVADEYRLNKFEGNLMFNGRSLSEGIEVVTSTTAEWSGSYLPTAAGSITGCVTFDKGRNCYVLYPRRTSDLAALPVDGTRLDGEKVVYFVPSSDPAADLFISETVMGNLDVNGNPLSSVARNNCNSKFVELYNPTSRNLTLSNYRVACIKYNNGMSRSDIKYYQFEAGYELKPGRTVVFKYVSTASGTGNGSAMSNTIWPKGYTADQSGLTSGVRIDAESVPGVILVLDARDYSKTIANSTDAFPSFDGNDILVVQKTDDGGATWTEIDRLFSLPTANGAFDGGVVYPFLFGYMRKPGVLGLPGNITNVQDSAYTAKESSRNRNDFESTQCNPTSGGAANWIQMPINSIDDLGVHTFSVRP